MRRQVFIDTSEYVAANFNFQARKFAALKSRVERGQLTIGMTTIVRNEIRARINAEIEHAKQSLAKFRRDARILRNSVDVTSTSFFNEMDFEGVRNDLLGSVETFIADAKIQLLDTSFVDTEEIFDQYFRGEAPFANKGKKSEFPDAFNIAVVKAWATEAQGKTLVVSSDSDVSEAVKTVEVIEFVGSIELLLDKLSHEFDFLASEASQAFDSISPLIEANLRDEITRIKLVMTNWPGEVTLLQVVDVRFDPSLVSVKQENDAFVSAEFDVYVSADLEVLFEYHDLSASSAKEAYSGKFDLPTKLLESRTNVFWSTSLTIRFEQSAPTRDVTFVSEWNIYGEIEIPFDGNAVSGHASTGVLRSAAV